MKRLREFVVRLGAFITRRRRTVRLQEEMEEHIALQSEENLRAGLSPIEARRQALLKFGAPETTKEAYREQESIPFLETLFRDVKHGVRVLAKSRGFAAAALVTLTLGIGANTAVFSIVYGIVFRPLPYPEPQRIVQLTESSPKGTDEEDVTLPELEWLQQHGSVFESVAGYTVIGFNLGTGNATERVKAAAVSSEYFHLLGVKPLLGRDFLPEENQGNGAHVAILSYETWKGLGGGDEGILGQTVKLDAVPYTVIGVMPPGMENPIDPILPGSTALWTPLTIVPHEVLQGENIALLGRLRPGIPLAGARAQMPAVTAEFRKIFPNALGPSTTLGLQSFQTLMVSGVRAILLVLLGAVGFVLLIACANVANLLLGRAATRGREFAVRAALGASRKRLVQQMLTESILLALFAAGLALLLARIVMHSLLTLSPSDLPRISDVHLDARAFAFTLVIAVLTAILFGLLPALRASSLRGGKGGGGGISARLGEGNSRAGTGRQHGRLRSILAVSEVALSLVLLTGAALMIETFWHVLKTDPGFNPRSVLSMEIWLAGPRYDSTAAVARYYDQALERIRPLPGVESASVVAAGLPFQRGGDDMVSVNGKRVPHSFGPRMITAGYFQTMGVPVMLGRAFSDADTATSPAVAVISQRAARLIFSEQNPIGRRLTTLGSEREVVGVVGDVKSYLDQTAQPMVYMPISQTPFMALKLYSSWFPTAIVVRTATDPLALSRSIEQQLQQIDPSVAAGRVRTMEQLRSSAVAMRQFNMLLLSVFAGLALILASVGVYGVIAYGVIQRKQEFGVRLALGARPRDILALVIGQGMMVAGLGVALGIAGSLALTRLLRAYLYEVAPSDPLALCITAVVLAGVAILACVAPARSATRVDPLLALRYE